MGPIANSKQVITITTGLLGRWLLLLSVATAAAGTALPAGAAGCPCEATLCRPLPLGSARDANETTTRVFAFHPARAIYNGSEHEWKLWDWDVVTTVATVQYCPDKYCDYPIAYGGHNSPNISQEMLCHAHARGVRVVGFTYWNWNTPTTWPQLANASTRKVWVDWQVATALRLGLDGVNQGATDRGFRGLT